MRTARIIGAGGSCYHCLSRILERRFWFGDTEKTYFLNTLRKLEQFSGVRVLSYAILDNHFHLLLQVPERPPSLSIPDLLSRITALYGPETAMEVEERLNQAKKHRSTKWLEQEINTYFARMFDLSTFMKELKQRFSQWFNRRKKRRGPLWEERFKSLITEDSAQALMTLAAYIDLNPVRAGICKDPKDYRWCGYGAALGGDAAAREGLRALAEAMHQPSDWKTFSKEYRMHLFGIGIQTEVRAGIDPRKVKETWEAGGALSLPELLRCRVRYLSDGVAFGSRLFVENVFENFRDRFGPKRKSASRAMQGGDWKGLTTLRDLRKDPISAPK
jgi:REP element-mobilizing transposase RayT